MNRFHFRARSRLPATAPLKRFSAGRSRNSKPKQKQASSKTMKKIEKIKLLSQVAAIALAIAVPGQIRASSHMDAPLITLDPAANTTDVYAFVDVESDSSKHLTVALG